MSVLRKCSLSGRDFELSEQDLAFYKKLELPLPTLCPEERLRRRKSFRMERSLYSRTCDKSGQRIISQHSADKPYPVYSCPEWWADGWDSKDYGRAFDFSKTFSENFQPLLEVVPQPALGVAYSSMENSEYCNQAGYLKDCYLIVNSDYSERCLYGKGVNRCYDCVDCFKIYDCEACYECLNLNNCKFCTYALDSQNCYECHYVANCIGCQDCFGCVNLRNQRFCFLNEKLSEAEYRQRVEQARANSSNKQLMDDFWEFRLSQYLKWMQESNTENCTGDYLVNCKDLNNCYDCEGVENSSHCCDLKKGEAVSYGNYDVCFFGVGVNECCEGEALGYGVNRAFFCKDVYGGNDLYYCWTAVNNCSYLLGCVGVKKQSYCVLNQQYSEDEYTALFQKIKSHMLETGEWGEFFPSSISPFGYNETVAQEYFPLSREQAVSAGLKWRERDEREFQPQSTAFPDEISEVGDDFVNETLSCEKSGKNYRINKLELDFYRKLKLPIPKLCPDERHLARLARRNPRRLSQRQCAISGTEILSTFPADPSLKVLCEEEYLRAMQGVSGE